MSTEADATNPAEEERPLDATEVEGDEAQNEASDETGEEEGGEPEPSDDLDDVEYEGKQYKLPKELREALLRQADYTRKTQDLANQRRGIEQRALEVERQAEIRLKTVDQRAVLHGLDQQLKRYESADWNAIEAQYGEAEANRLWRDYSLLREEKQRAQTALTAAENSVAADLNKQFVERRTQFVEKLHAIKGFDQEADKALTKTLLDAGFDPEELRTLDDPRTVPLLELVLLGLRAKAVQQAPTPKPKQDFKPVTKVSAPAPAGKDPTRMTDEEWARWRDDQVRKSARR